MTALELPITGMTCASCANRVERRLNKLDGVTATVNYATEKARVTYDADAVAPADLVAAVEAAGYGAAIPTEDEQPEADPLRLRLIVAALLSVPALLLAMVPALQFDNFQWLTLNLVTPVVLWAAWPFHRAAWANLKHGTATMDTLISVGVLAAWLWSLYALFLGDAGMNDMRMGFDLIPNAGEGADQIYLETAGIVTTFLLAGRWFEARAKRRAGAALQALLELGAKDVELLDGRRVAVLFAGRGRPLRRAPGREGRDRRRRRGRPLGRGHEPAHGRVGAGRGRAGIVGRGRHGERRRTARRAGDARRLGHRSGADRAAGRGGPDRQGAGPAARGSHLGRVRARRARACRGDPRVLAGNGGDLDVRVHRRRRRADHRLPVRARAGDADGAAGRHRPRRPTRPADQGAGSAGVHPPSRHDRARQDRNGHDRADVARRRGRGWGVAGRGAAFGGRRRGGVRASGRARRSRGRLGTTCRPSRTSSNHAGLGVEGVVWGRSVVVGRLVEPGPLADAKLEAEARGHTAVVASIDGRPAALFAVADTVKPTSV